MEELIAVPAITVLCYLLAELYKTMVNDDTYHKHIPVLCGVCGCAFGVACYLLIPGYIPAENLIVAAAIGVVSGIAATGVNQVYKQETEQ